MNVAELIEGPVATAPPMRPVDGGRAPAACGGALPGVARPSAAGSLGRVPLRPGELPAPVIVPVLAGELEAGAGVVIRGRVLVVETKWHRAGTVRLQLSDGSTHTAGLHDVWQVRRG